MKPDLNALEDAVCDERSFITSLSALAADREDEVKDDGLTPVSPYGPGSHGWQNGTIKSFLGAAAAWAESSINGMPLYQKPENPWKRCAQIIMMGKLYE